ncbi:GNAT family N-acetyltransferase [Skermanella stibiiresistens]|nr:GNAT family N-acetyltransferase [Skermanella stibiiresistens]
MAEVTDNEARHRYEMTVDGTVAFIKYMMRDDAIVLVHTEVPDALSGHGVGSKLVRGTLDDIRRRGLKVVPSCTFVRGFLDKHPEYQDLVRATD